MKAPPGYPTLENLNCDILVFKPFAFTNVSNVLCRYPAGLDVHAVQRQLLRQPPRLLPLRRAQGGQRGGDDDDVSRGRRRRRGRGSWRRRRYWILNDDRMSGVRGGCWVFRGAAVVLGFGFWVEDCAGGAIVFKFLCNGSRRSRVVSSSSSSSAPRGGDGLTFYFD